MLHFWADVSGGPIHLLQYSRESFWDFFFLFWNFYDIWSDLVRKNSDNWVKLMVDLKVSVFLEFITFLGGEKLSRFMECHLNSSLAFEYFHRLFPYSIWRFFSASGNEVSSMNRTQAILLVSCQLDFSASFQGWLVSDPQFFSFPWWLLQDVELFCYSEKRVRQG